MGHGENAMALFEEKGQKRLADRACRSCHKQIHANLLPFMLLDEGGEFFLRHLEVIEEDRGEQEGQKLGDD